MIAAYKGKSLISRLIRFFNWSEYSHISWVCDDGTEYEAWHIGGVKHVHKFGQNHTKGTEVDLFDITLTKGQKDDLEKFLSSKVGCKYDFQAIFGFIIRDSIANKNKLFCSEYIFEAFKSIKISLLNNIEAYKVFPGLLVLSPLLTYKKTIKIGEEIL